MTAGVVLTGGRSTRLGRDKATLVVDGTTLAERAVIRLAAVCDVVVEVGPGVTDRPSVREEPAFAGPVAALLAALDLVEPPVVLLACDHVAMTSELLARLASDPRDTVVPVVDGRPQWVAARYGPAAVARLRASYAAGDRSFRALDLDALGAADATFPAAAFVDIDTESDLATWAGP